MDYKKLNKYFGWKPKYKFSNTLPELINWYKKIFKKNLVYDYSNRYGWY